LIPDGTYVARVKAVRQKAKDGRSWTVVSLEIVQGFWKRRVVFDIIRRHGFSREAVDADGERESSLVGLSAGQRKHDRACRQMIGTLVEVEVGSQWRGDLERQANRVRAYRWTPQF
jgi:hypothetical protein